MAVHSARPFRTGWITAATCSCLLAGWVGWQPATVRAQLPVSSARPSQVEMWQGNSKRAVESTSTSLKPLVPIAPPPSTIEPVGTPLPPLPPTLQSTPWTPPPAIPAQAAPSLPPVAEVKTTPSVQREELKKLSQQLIRSTSKLANNCQTALDSCATSLRSSGDRLVETLSVPVRTRIEKHSPTTTVVVTPVPSTSTTDAQEDSLPWYKVVWLQVIVGGSALVVGPLMVALLLGIMLRRSGFQFRVELVNAPGTLGSGVAYGVSRIDTNQPDVPARPVGRIEPDLASLSAVAALEAVTFPELKPGEEAPMTGEKFDLGPTYEEERLAKQEAELLREKAILQEIFEENLRLQEELRSQLETASASSAMDEPVATGDFTVPVTEVLHAISEPIGYLTDDQDQTV